MSMMHADVAVVGSELCGLAAGALLAHSRRRVVVLLDGESDSTPLGGRLVPRAPTLWQHPHDGPAAKLIEELGLKQDVRRVLGEPTGLGIVDDPDIRMELHVDEKRRARELIRVFGADEGERVDRIVAAQTTDVRAALLLEATRIHEEGFFARRRERRRSEQAGSAIDPTSPDEATAQLLTTPLGAALPYLLPYVQASEEAPVDAVGGTLAAATVVHGTVSRSESGLGLRSTLQRLFFRVIQGHGGEVVEDGRVLTAQGAGKKLTTLKSDGKNDWTVKAIIDATEGRSLLQRCPEGRAKTRSEKLQQQLEPVSGAAVVRWLLPRAVLPRGLPPRTLLLPTEAGKDAGGLLAVYDDLPMVDGRRPKDDDLVGVVVAHWSRHEADQETARRLEAKLTHLLPFASTSVVERDVLTGDDAWRALPTYRSSGGELNRFGGRRPKTGFANMLRGGRDLVPRLGLDGELAAARSVAAAVSQALGKRQGGDEM